LFSPDQEPQHYYQLQAQLKLCEAVYCDFVRWSEDKLLVLRILLAQNLSMVHVIEEVKYGALPELLGKWYTKTNSHLLISKEKKPIEN